jgi:hypothetical protein
MQPDDADKAGAACLPIEAGAKVTLKKNGRASLDTSVSVSGCGVLLHFDEPPQLGIGDQVICEFKISSDTDPRLPYWVVGMVSNIDDCCATVDLAGAPPILT